MNPVLGFVIGLFATIVLVPPLTRVAGLLHLQDRPNRRKIHHEPIPCVGGFGLFAGVLVPILLWLPLDTTMQSYVVAVCLIFIFGVWDDIRDLNYKWKLLAQVIPVAIVVHGGVVMDHLPFFGFDPAPPWISYLVTGLFLLAVINAVNLFDGLDGLAGGCMLLTLGAIAFLAYEVDGFGVTLIALSTMGAILGFLYFNTYPARVFMGDAGSQLLGFTVAVLAIQLTQETHTALNPALPLLLLGLPILDTLWVFTLRIRQGRSPFVGDRQHLHYQALNFGFSHTAAVSLIYLIQAVMVVSALLVIYQSDLVVVGTFLLECGVLTGLVYWARSVGWRKRPAGSSVVMRFVEHRNTWLRRLPQSQPVLAYYIEASLSIFLLLGAIFTGSLDRTNAVLALGVAGLMLFATLFLAPWTYLFIRIGVYVASLLALIVFLPLSQESAVIGWTIDIFLLILAIVLALAIRVTRKDLFQVTPQDLLIAFFALAVAFLPQEIFGEFPVGYVFLRVTVLFYACEYLVGMAAHRYIGLRVSTFAVFLIVGARGWIL